MKKDESVARLELKLTKLAKLLNLVRVEPNRNDGQRSWGRSGSSGKRGVDR